MLAAWSPSRAAVVNLQSSGGLKRHLVRRSGLMAEVRQALGAGHRPGAGRRVSPNSFLFELAMPSSTLPRLRHALELELPRRMPVPPEGDGDFIPPPRRRRKRASTPDSGLRGPRSRIASRTLRPTPRARIKLDAFCHPFLVKELTRELPSVHFSETAPGSGARTCSGRLRRASACRHAGPRPTQPAKRWRSMPSVTNSGKTKRRSLRSLTNSGSAVSKEPQLLPSSSSQLRSWRAVWYCSGTGDGRIAKSAPIAARASSSPRGSRYIENFWKKEKKKT